MLSPLTRIPRVMELVEQQAYFVIHAPRQIGKTTAMMAIAQELTKRGRYVAALIGLRDVRDYKVAAGGSDRLNTASPFNVKAGSITLSDFTAEEVAELYSQHTAATGQAFTDEAIHRAFYLTQGQPWLVNALAKEVVEQLLPDRAIAITPTQIDQAKDILIQAMAWPASTQKHSLP